MVDLLLIQGTLFWTQWGKTLFFSFQFEILTFISMLLDSWNVPSSMSTWTVESMSEPMRASCTLTLTVCTAGRVTATSLQLVTSWSSIPASVTSYEPLINAYDHDILLKLLIQYSTRNMEYPIKKQEFRVKTRVKAHKYSLFVSHCLRLQISFPFPFSLIEGMSTMKTFEYIF